MSNLIDELGLDYFNSRFAGSFFLDDEGNPSRIVRAEGRHSVAFRSLVDGEEVNKTLTRAFFSDMQVFATPPLGWRSLDSGQALYYLSRNNRSYHRGLSLKNLVRTEHPLSSSLGIHMKRSTTAPSLHELRLGKAVLLPEYMPFREGVTNLLNEEIIFFAVSEHMAVAASEEGGADLLFSKKVVGKIDKEGNLECNIPTITMLLEEEE